MAAEPCAPMGNFNCSGSSQNPGPCKLPVATGPMVAAAPLWRRLWVRSAKKLKIGCVFSVSQHTVVQALHSRHALGAHAKHARGRTDDLRLLEQQRVACAWANGNPRRKSRAEAASGSQSMLSDAAA